MPSDRRSAVVGWADRLLRDLPPGPPVRVEAAAGGLVCLVQVWSAGQLMPTAGRERRRSGGRDGCRADVLAAVRAAGRPLTRKQVLRALRAAGVPHGPGTVAKALAELTGDGDLVNPRDKRGYRLPEWVRPHPTLFPAGGPTDLPAGPPPVR